jgi:hypothetical protein
MRCGSDRPMPRTSARHRGDPRPCVAGGRTGASSRRVPGRALASRIVSADSSMTGGAAGRVGTWVAQDGVQVVAFAVTGPSQDADATERTGEVYAIIPRARSCRYGRGPRAVRARGGRPARAGFEAVTLWVLETNDRARRFYEVAGWAHDGTVTSERVDCEMRPTCATGRPVAGRLPRASGFRGRSWP